MNGWKRPSLGNKILTGKSKNSHASEQKLRRVEVSDHTAMNELSNLRIELMLQLIDYPHVQGHTISPTQSGSVPSPCKKNTSEYNQHSEVSVLLSAIEARKTLLIYTRSPLSLSAIVCPKSQAFCSTSGVGDIFISTASPISSHPILSANGNIFFTA